MPRLRADSICDLHPVLAIDLVYNVVYNVGRPIDMSLRSFDVISERDIAL